MNAKTISTVVILLSFATSAGAQTKISGTLQYGKPDISHAIELGDRPNHLFVIQQAKCTWTKPLIIAGIEVKEGIGTSFLEVAGNSSRFRGYDVGTMANGDKCYSCPQGSLTLKDGTPQGGEGKWTPVGVTGKPEGIQGKVTSGR